MTRAPSRLPLLIAISLLTAGLAIAGTPSSLASEAGDTAVVREEPNDAEPPRNSTLAGQLTNASSGEPVAGAELRLLNVWEGEDGEHKGRDILHAETDEEGRYRVNVSQGRLDLRIDHPGYQLARAELPIDGNLTLDVPLEPARQDQAVVEGTVTSEDGAPLAEAYVRVNAVHDCEEREDCATHARGDRGSAREVETDQGSITIHYDPREDRYVGTQTDEDGRYEVRVPPGTYRVQAHAEDHLRERTRVETQAGQRHQVDLSLEEIPSASVTVEGRIVDEQTGEAVPHARVSLDNQRWGTHNSTYADEDGRFQLAIQPGYVIVEIRADEGYRLPCEPREHGEPGDGGDAEPRGCQRQQREQAYMPWTATLAPDEGQTVTIDQALQPKPVPETRIDGWVVNASSGEAVPNATLLFANEETNEWGRAETAQDGSFEIRVDDGYHTVRIHAEGYFANATVLAVDGDERARFELTPGQPADGGCCYRVHHETATDGAGGDEAAAGEVDASRDAQASPSGEQTYAGGPADLGPPPAPSEKGTAPYRDAPGLGAVGLALALGAGAVLVGRRGA